MTTKNLTRAVAAALVTAALISPCGIAHADNSNDNSNTNTNSDAGGYLNAGGGEDDSKGWPPTKADWPPSDMSVGGLSQETGGGGGKSGSDKPAPIVMPE